MTRSAEVEVVIVGAGAAGIGAALEARERGRSFRLLEAAPRSGGRAWTDVRSLRHPFDLGCHWLHSASLNPLRVLADALSVPYVARAVDQRLHDGSNLLDAAVGKARVADWDRSVEASRRTHAAGRDVSVAGVADRSLPGWPYYAQWCEHLYATALDQISVADLALENDTHENYRVPSGYGALLQRVAHDLPVELDCPVLALDLSGPDVGVETPRGRLRAGAVVMTVSVGVLQAEGIAVKPGGWPLWKQRALEGVGLGSSTKVGLELDPEALDPELVDAFVHCLSDPPANIAWHLAPSGEGLAVAYLGGAFSRELCLAGDAEMVAFVREDLVRRLGSEVQRHLGRALTTPWDRDPRVRGGYSFRRVGPGNPRTELAAPVEERVFFAGEACSPDFFATAHGAYLSGRAAVAAIPLPG